MGRGLNSIESIDFQSILLTILRSKAPWNRHWSNDNHSESNKNAASNLVGSTKANPNQTCIHSNNLFYIYEYSIIMKTIIGYCTSVLLLEFLFSHVNLPKIVSSLPARMNHWIVFGVCRNWGLPRCRLNYLEQVEASVLLLVLESRLVWWDTNCPEEGVESTVVLSNRSR